MATKVAVIGATGRLGQLVCRIVESAADFDLVARLDSKSELSQMLTADIAVDVTLPHVSPGVVDFAIAHGINVLVGTSGWSADRIEHLERTLREKLAVGVVLIPNFSVGSVLATSFAAMAGRFFSSIEIVEAHSALKVDSPSGTAVRTAEQIAAARHGLGPVVAPHADQRARGQQVASVPIHSLRLHGVVAKQDVHFGGVGEVLTISHETLAPSAYETGILLALRAARTARGLTVGLERVMDLRFGGVGASGAPADAPAVETAAPAGAPAVDVVPPGPLAPAP